MDKKRLDFYRKKLEAKREELMRLMAQNEQEAMTADDATQDIADKAANSYTKEFLFSQSNNERFILQLVDEALKRLKNGGFGLCVQCNEEIQQKRIDAVPWARHCISCQEKQEQGLL
ncbi:MAG TPA: TraR/DksA C4-type zinc finger protein [Candidatus Xenobia bacterium]|nr:TraR/DksA C4-type zinc finger protein [Candidatus Xenobia bacterium]